MSGVGHADHDVAAASPSASADDALVPSSRWSRAAVPIGVGRDGVQWLGAAPRGLVLYEDDREVSRFAVPVAATDTLAALPDGGWVAGARILGPDGGVRYDGHARSNRFGMFGSARAMAVSADGTVAILAGSDQPGTCLGDAKCGDRSSSRGALLRLEFGPPGGYERPTERVLIEHEERRDFRVAACRGWVVATEGTELSVWPATGDDPARVVTFDGPRLDRLGCLRDRHLVGTRWIDAESAEIVVFDANVGYARTASWRVEGTIEALAMRPDRPEIAVATAWYRARERVEIDEKRIALYTADGTTRARIDVPGVAVSLAWSPRGDALFASIAAGTPEDQLVVRYLAR